MVSFHHISVKFGIAIWDTQLIALLKFLIGLIFSQVKMCMKKLSFLTNRFSILFLTKLFYLMIKIVLGRMTKSKKWWRGKTGYLNVKESLATLTILVWILLQKIHLVPPLLVGNQFIIDFLVKAIFVERLF